MTTKAVYKAMDLDELTTLMLLVDKDDDITQHLTDEQRGELENQCKKFTAEFWEDEKRDPTFNEWTEARARILLTFLQE